MTAWRRVVSGLVLALVAMVAVGAAALTRLPRPPTWAAAVIAGVAFLVGLLLDPLTRVAAEWVERPGRRHAVLLAQTRMHNRRGGLRRVRQCGDPLALGVHPAADAGHRRAGMSPVPRYVRRDADQPLQEEFERGGLVVIEGASTAGKTRLAYEAMHAYAPGRWLVVPAGVTALREILKAGVMMRDAVVWLDDVERYLAGGGLDGAILDALCPPGSRDVLVLATLRAEARQELTGTGPDTTAARAVDEVMRRARIIPIELHLTGAERDRAERFRGDERIADALDQTSGAGFTEYLAAGPVALDRWQSASRGQNPTAGAVISATVDAHRAGHWSPLSAELLESLYPHYLDDRTRRRGDGPTFAEALAWAAAPVKGASGCLTPAAGGYRPFDYLVDHAQRTQDLHDIPRALWDGLLAEPDGPDLLSISAVAYDVQEEICHAAMRRCAEAGNTLGMYGWGLLLVEQERLGEAERWLRRAAEAGHTDAMRDLGALLVQDGRSQDAVRWLRPAAEAGDADAMYQLGIELDDLEAEQWHRRAAETGHSGAMRYLGYRLMVAGLREEAELWLRRAAEAGVTDAMSNLGVLLFEAGCIEEAKRWYLRAADDGHTGARYNLGILLRRTGEVGEAEQWYRRAADGGYPQAMHNLAVLMAETGRSREAERWWRRAAETGHPNAMHSLAVLLDEDGQTEEAEQWYRRAAGTHHMDAMNNLGILLAEDGRTEEAERWLRSAAADGHTDAMYNMSNLLQLTGQTRSAEQWLRRATEAERQSA